MRRVHEYDVCPAARHCRRHGGLSPLDPAGPPGATGRDRAPSAPEHIVALLPVVALAISGGLATIRPPGPALRSSIQHFAAGVVFAVAAGELLPEVKHALTPLQVVASFTLGVLVMFALERLSSAAGGEKARESSNPGGLMATIGIDVTLDGVLLGIGFAAGATTGILLAVALTLEALSLGSAVAVGLVAAGWQARTSFLVTAATGLLFLIGTGLGVLVLHGVSFGIMALVLSFGLAALLYLVTEELLVEAHEVPETPIATAMFFAGFLTLVVLGMVV